MPVLLPQSGSKHHLIAPEHISVWAEHFREDRLLSRPVPEGLSQQIVLRASLYVDLDQQWRWLQVQRELEEEAETCLCRLLADGLCRAALKGH